MHTEICEYTQYNEEEILRLYDPFGRTYYTKDPGALRRGFAGSTVLAARENGALPGIIRALSDGATVVFIGDILVAPCAQRKGIGTALVKAMLDRCPDVRRFELATDDTPETAAFYRAPGFRPYGEPGCLGFMKF